MLKLCFANFNVPLCDPVVKVESASYFKRKPIFRDLKMWVYFFFNRLKLNTL